MMHRVPLFWLIFSGYWLLSFSSHAQQPSNPALHNLLTDVIKRSHQGQLDKDTLSSASSWLDGAPSLSVNYLKSQQKQGSDETELNLNLPIKSATQRQTDNDLRQNDNAIMEANQQRKALYYSGLLRQSIWSVKIAQSHINAMDSKIKLLNKLEQQFSRQVKAGSTTTYGLLVTKQSRLAAQTEKMNYHYQLQQWLRQYKQLTGQEQLPASIIEKAPKDGLAELHAHPNIRLLQAERYHAQLTLRSASQSAQPWNVALTAKRIKSPGLTENQIGVGVAIPLSFGNKVNQLDRSTWLNTAARLDLELQQVHQSLLSQWTNTEQQWQLLSHKQQLLDQQAAIAASILDHIRTLQNLNEIEQEMFLKRSIEAIDIQQASILNKVLLHQQQARMNQAAGVSL